MATSETVKWEKRVLEEQQLYYEMLGDRDWDCYKTSEVEFLERNVGHAIFGPPEQLPDDKNGNTGYKDDQLEHIRKIINVMKQYSKYPSSNGENDVWVSVVFVCLNIENHSVPVPVFRIPHYQPKVGCKINHQFVDTNCRVYEDWKGYLKNNCLPKCTYCYPKGGIYNGDNSDRVLVEFGQTPASSFTNRMCNVLDTASTVVTVGGMGVAAVGLFATVAAPVAVASTVGAVATGIYGVARSAVTLADRGKHKQSTGLQDAESRSCWLAVAGNSLCIASSHAIRSVTKMAQQGRVLSSAGRLLVNAVNFSSLTVNGLGLLNNLVLLRRKAQENELRALDVFQFASSLLFFTMSAVNIRTANTIIRETQDGMIGDYEASLRSNRHRRQFRRIVRETRGEEGNTMDGNARVIRGITQISNRDDFFAGLVRVRRQFAKSDAKVVLTDTGLVEINGELRLHPMKFWEINKMQREFILDATKNLNQGIWTQEHFNREMHSVCQEENLVFRSQQTGAAPNMNQMFHPDEDISLPPEVRPNDVGLSMSHHLCKFTLKYRHQILNIARNLAEMMGFDKTAEIIKIADFLANNVEQITAELEVKYQQDLTSAQRMQGENFNRENFDRDYNIQGNRRDHFIKIVLTNYNSYDLLVQLKNSYKTFTSTGHHSSSGEAPPATSQTNVEAAELTVCVRRFARQHRKRIIAIAINLCDILGFRSTEELIEVTNFVADYIEKVLSEMEVKYEDSINEAKEREGQDFSREKFDKKYNIDGKSRDHFLENIISNYDDYKQLKQLQIAYEENCTQREDTSLYSEERDFKVQGKLSEEEIYNIAGKVTGLYLFEGNATLLRDGPVSFVTITDPNIEPVTVIIESNVDNNTVNANLII